RTAPQAAGGHRAEVGGADGRTRLGGFGFSGEKADTPIAQLSGGERARLLLAIATLDRPNLLILDEPTNHLDIYAREELLTALNDYEGAVLLISHDRRLIEACADRRLLVAQGRAVRFEGDLEDYKRQILSATAETSNERRETKSASKSMQRREAAERRLILKPLKDAMDKAEREVSARH